MQKLKYKYIIGTNVMWYEIDLLPTFLDSVADAVNFVGNKNNITIEVYLNRSTKIEKLDESKTSWKEIVNKYEIACENFFNKTSIAISSGRYYNGHITMVDYRRDLNNRECLRNDYVIWGETDCLVPKDMFACLDTAKDLANSLNINRYVSTFATRKMWDDSWKPIEHIKFTDCSFYEKSDEKAWTEQSSIRYTMTKEEMNDINSEYPDLKVECIGSPIFDGSILCLSSDLIKAGVNIPVGMKGISGEDAAMIQMCRKIMGNQYRQFIFKNRLKVHNREHPEKRNYVLNSTQQNKGDVAMQHIADGKRTLQQIFFDPQSKIE